ncbi:MAG: hypothetical protein ILA15_01800 [Clostridiales bacterium]|nr:hypothetical protein [Clostridiales bacterium]
MLRYVIGVSLVAVVLLILRSLTDRKIARKYQYAMWLAIPLFMLLFPIVNIKVNLPELPEVNEVQKVHVAASEPGDNAASEEPVIINTSPAVKRIDWGASLRDTSLLVSVLIIAFLTLYNLGFVLYVVRRRSFIRTDGDSGLKVYKLDYKTTPFLLGRSIYLGSEEESFSRCVLFHEVCHYRQGDMFWIILRHLVLALNWYNPLIWIAFIKSGHDCELACDEKVLKLLGQNEAAEYGRTLLSLVSKKAAVRHRFTLTTGMRGTYKTMKKRITSIKHPNKNSRVVLASCAALILLAAGCSLVEYGKKMSIDEATALALSAARVNSEDVTVSSTELVDEDGRQLYEIEFVSYGDVYRVYQYGMDADTGELVYACCALEEPRYPLDERLFGEWVVTENSTVMPFVGEDEILGYTFNGDNTGYVTVLMDGEETNVDYTWTASYPYITFYVEGCSIPRATYSIGGDCGIILSQGTRVIRRQS